jgi:ABC-2 type transport system ATP-binding protein
MSEKIVRVHGVVKRFGDVLALDQVDLEFEPGIIYGLLGPNGAGKTTLINVLTTLLKPDAGHAEVAGIDVLSDPVTARSHLGLAGQFAAVDDYLTGRENVEMIGRLYNLSRRDARARAEDVLERIDLVDAADRPVRTYSGGMRRRLDLAASMVGRPKVLFLDEPTTGIDPRSRIGIWDLIEDLVADGTTILLTTQYLDEADQLAARVAVIDHGRVITEGTPAELKEQLGGAVVELIVPEEDRRRAVEVLAEATGDTATVEPGAHHLTLHAPDGSQTLLRTVRALDAAAIHAEDIQLRRPTLDDVFLELTGHVAEGSEDAPGNRRSARRAGRRRP